MQSQLSSERSSQIIHSLHAILKPFLLRRLKVDVETSLPPKKEYVLYAPLSVRQNEVYDRVVTGGLRAFLMGKGKGGEDGKGKTKKAQVDVNAPRQLRMGGKGKGRKRYDVDGDDDEYFERLEKGEDNDDKRKKHQDVDDLGRDYQYKVTRKSPINDSNQSCHQHNFVNSKTGQQHEAAEYSDAATQSLLASFPVRLATRLTHSSTYFERRTSQR